MHTILQFILISRYSPEPDFQLSCFLAPCFSVEKMAFGQPGSSSPATP